MGIFSGFCVVVGPLFTIAESISAELVISKSKAIDIAHAALSDVTSTAELHGKFGLQIAVHSRFKTMERYVSGLILFGVERFITH